VADYIWTGDEAVRCEIEIEVGGDRRPPQIFKAAARRIQRDGLQPMALRDRKPVDYVETATATLPTPTFSLSFRLPVSCLQRVRGVQLRSWYLGVGAWELEPGSWQPGAGYRASI
jgi:hypothetical protein